MSPLLMKEPLPEQFGKLTAGVSKNEALFRWLRRSSATDELHSTCGHDA
jgi:hypothetical protein